MKILIMTDVEGCAGVLDFENWDSPKGRYYEKAKRFLTEETNAAISGFIEEGVDEIVVKDGHGYGGIDPELLNEHAILVRGRYENIYPCGLDTNYDALAFVGQHAKAGTPYAHLSHTGSCRAIDVRINGLSVGEYGQVALCAMELGLPTILACGDLAFTKEAKALTPGVITASVKEGLLPDDGYRNASTEEYSKAKLSAAHLSPVKARKIIREAARKAVKKLKASPEKFKYPELSPPYEIIREYRRTERDNDPAFTSTNNHPTSIIKLLNLPLNQNKNKISKNRKAIDMDN